MWARAKGEDEDVGGRSIGKKHKTKTPLSMLTTTATTDERLGRGGGGNVGRGKVVKEVAKYGAAVASMSLSACLPALPFSERLWPGTVYHHQ